jgi:hypothetical protein
MLTSIAIRKRAVCRIDSRLSARGFKGVSSLRALPPSRFGWQASNPENLENLENLENPENPENLGNPGDPN